MLATQLWPQLIQQQRRPFLYMISLFGLILIALPVRITSTMQRAFCVATMHNKVTISFLMVG